MFQLLIAPCNGLSLSSFQGGRTDAGRRCVLKKAGLASLSIITSCSSPAYAERTLGTVTESYNRYVPRMVAGFAYLKDARYLLNGEWEGGEEEKEKELKNLVESIRAERGSKVSALRGTMKIFATAFSDSVVTETSRELQLATLKMSDELGVLAAAVEKNDFPAANKAYEKAVYFGDVYAGIANASIPRSLTQIVGPKGNAPVKRKEVDPLSMPF